MDIYKNNWTGLQHKAFSELCRRAGEKLSQRELAKILKVSPMSITNTAKKLKETGLIKIETTKTINFISLNTDSERAINLKRAKNLESIYLTGLPETLENTFPGATIILFGSYSKGEDTKSSDIDIAIIGRKPKQIQLEKYEEKLNRNINISHYETWKGIQKNLKNNILNGITLCGAIDL